MRVWGISRRRNRRGSKRYELLVPACGFYVPEVHAADVGDVDWSHFAEEEGGEEGGDEGDARGTGVGGGVDAGEAEDLGAGEALWGVR